MRLAHLSFFVLFFFLSVSAFGQSDKGTITGRVTDSTGAVIQGASVQLTPSNLSTTSVGLG